MSKKSVNEQPDVAMTEAPPTAEEDAEMFADDFNEPQDAFGDLDFNVNDEYKPDPLVPKGTYHAAVVKVIFNPSQHCIAWTVSLHDNGGVMNDGETPIDGCQVQYRNWLPKPGDESLMTASGRNTKRQSKINMMKDFQEGMHIDMSTPARIATALNEQHWVGLEVSVEISITEYQGRFRNEITKMVASTEF